MMWRMWPVYSGVVGERFVSMLDKQDAEILQALIAGEPVRSPARCTSGWRGCPGERPSRTSRTERALRRWRDLQRPRCGEYLASAVREACWLIGR